MAPRRRRAEPGRRRWPLALLFAAGAVLGAVLWAWTPTLPADYLIRRHADARSTFLDVGGARVHLRDEGDRDALPIVLVHGALGSLHVWEGWVEALKGRARLISVDLPGHGLTGAWPREEHTIDAYADFVEVLVDTLNLDRFVLVGHSMGGAVAWSFAATRPDRVSHLVLVGSSGYPRDGEAPLRSRLGRQPLIGELLLWFKPESVARRALAGLYGDPVRATPERARRFAELQRFPGNREAALQRARLQEPIDPTPLRRLDVPTLLVWGARDRWVPPADAFRFQRDIKGAALAIFEKLGHNPMEEDPAATAAAVDAFLPDSLPTRPAPEPPGEVQPAVEPERD